MSATLSPFTRLQNYVTQLKQKTASGETRQVELPRALAFQAGEQHFLLSIADVLEISEEMNRITPLPFSPLWLLGIANFRNEIYSVIDFPKFLDSASKEKNKVYILLRGIGKHYALQVESVAGIHALDISAEKVDGMPAWCDGAANVDGENWWKVDLAALLSDPVFNLNSIK